MKRCFFLFGPLIGIADPENFRPDRSRAAFENGFVPNGLGGDVQDAVKSVVIQEYTYWDQSNVMENI